MPYNGTHFTAPDVRKDYSEKYLFHKCKKEGTIEPKRFAKASQQFRDFRETLQSPAPPDPGVPGVS